MQRFLYEGNNPTSNTIKLITQKLKRATYLAKSYSSANLFTFQYFTENLREFTEHLEYPNKI